MKQHGHAFDSRLFTMTVFHFSRVENRAKDVFDFLVKHRCPFDEITLAAAKKLNNRTVVEYIESSGQDEEKTPDKKLVEIYTVAPKLTAEVRSRLGGTEIEDQTALSIQACLDGEQLWFTKRVQVPGLIQKLAEIGGPAVLDRSWPREAVVAGGSLASVYVSELSPGHKSTGYGSTDLDVFVSTHELAERLRGLFVFYGYEIMPQKRSDLFEFKYGSWIGSIFETSVYCRVQVVVHRYASNPDYLVRSFDLFCSEAFWTREHPETINVTASGLRDWQDMLCRGGRSGLSLSQRRLEKYTRKGFSHVQTTILEESVVNSLLFDNGPVYYPDFEKLVHFWETPRPDAVLLWTPYIELDTADRTRSLELDPENNYAHYMFLSHIPGREPRITCSREFGAGRYFVRLLVEPRTTPGTFQVLWTDEQQGKRICVT
jgi:hypothetical protein